MVKSIAVNADLPDEKPLDNYFPPLAERYASFSVPQDMVGTYMFNEFPVTAEVSKKDGLLFMEVSAAGFQFYLVPEGDGKFTSLDGQIKLQFDSKENKISGMQVETPDMKLSANKM